MRRSEVTMEKIKPKDDSVSSEYDESNASNSDDEPQPQKAKVKKTRKAKKKIVDEPSTWEQVIQNKQRDIEDFSMMEGNADHQRQERRNLSEQIVDGTLPEIEMPDIILKQPKTVYKDTLLELGFTYSHLFIDDTEFDP